MRAHEWTNWAGTVTTTLERVATPSSSAEVALLIADAAERRLPVKAVGSGHSFTGVAATTGVQVNLGRMSGVTSVDPERHEVTVRAGTPLHVLNEELASLGLALPNLGDIDRQSISGATSTGTHGTGLKLQGLAAGIRSLEIVLADSRVVRCSPDVEPELFEAARLGLGSLGVITELTLAVVPAFLLHAVEKPEPLTAVLEAIDDNAQDNDHFEFYWFPHTDRTNTKRNNRVPAGSEAKPLPRWRERLDDDLLSNRLFEGMNRAATRVPRIIRPLNAISARALSERTFTDTSHRVFITERRVRFAESEFAFERAALPEVLKELKGWLDAHEERITFPVECRFAAADDLWLSTAHGRDSCYVAVHQYHRRDPAAYFRAFQDIAVAHGGRPHWGKMHALDADYFAANYPRFADFREIRDRIDPDRRFGNDYLRQVLGS